MFTRVLETPDPHRWARLALAAGLWLGGSAVGLALAVAWWGRELVFAALLALLWAWGGVEVRFEPVPEMDAQWVEVITEEDVALPLEAPPPPPPPPVPAGSGQPPLEDAPAPSAEPPPLDEPTEAPVAPASEVEPSPPVTADAPTDGSGEGEGPGAGDEEGARLRVTLPSDQGPYEARFEGHTRDGIFGALAARAWQEAQVDGWTAPLPAYGAPEVERALTVRAQAEWPEKVKPSGRAPWCDLVVTIEATGRVSAVRVTHCPNAFIPSAQAAAFATRFAPTLAPDPVDQTLLVHFQPPAP